jgi:hypothetical protein
MVNEGIDVLGRRVQNGEISIPKVNDDGILALGSFQEVGRDLVGPYVVMIMIVRMYVHVF